jgi:phage gp45-like
VSYIDDMIETAVAPLRLMFELVTDGSVDDDGAFSGDGLDGEGIDGQIGWHFGFYSRPRDGFTGVVAKLGGGASSLLFAFRDKQYEIALEKGEVAMVSAAGARHLLDKDGNIKTDAASGKDIVFNGGTNPVGRKGDAVKVTIPIGTVIVSVSGGVGTSNASPIVLNGTIDAGAPNVKA